jgi:uracil-DNA glycosylase family 4
MKLAELYACRRCPRLVEHLAQTRTEFPEYHNRPVAPWGKARVSLLIVGLAPGKHGANASGRPFTGDASGQLLLQVLCEQGFAQIDSKNKESIQLIDCRITNAVKCLPPGNLPSGAEITECNDYLSAEIAVLRKGACVLALGSVAHRAIIRACGLRQKDFVFTHGAQHTIGSGLALVDSYHCSRYNINTGRLTPEMFARIFDDIKILRHD